MIVRALLVGALLALAASRGIAEEPCDTASKDPIDAWLDSAMAEDYSTAGMRDATNRAREMWDQEMNASYGRLMKKLSADQQAALRTAQRNWIAFRDSEGVVISKVVAEQQGTMFQLVATGKWLELTKSRTLELRAYEAAAGGS